MDFKYFVYFKLIKQLNAAQENPKQSKGKGNSSQYLVRSKSIELEVKLYYVAKKWK